MTAIGQLREIWRYPISSASGETVSECAIDAGGLRGDRIWGLMNLASGEVAAPDSKKAWRPAPKVEARNSPAGLEIRLPDGDWIAAGSDAARAGLAALLGFPAEIRRHPAPDLAEGTPTVAPRYTRGHVHVLSTRSIASLQTLLPDSAPLHPRRFRPNLLIDLPESDEPFPETQWGVGREFQIGSARLQVAENCVRCGFTVLEQGDQPQDPAVLNAITRHNGTYLGVLCRVLETGEAKLADPVTLL